MSKEKTKVELEISEEHIKELQKIFEQEQDFKPTDLRDLLIIGILKQIVDKTK